MDRHVESRARRRNVKPGARMCSPCSVCKGRREPRAEPWCSPIEWPRAMRMSKGKQGAARRMRVKAGDSDVPGGAEEKSLKGEGEAS